MSDAAKPDERRALNPRVLLAGLAVVVPLVLVLLVNLGRNPHVIGSPLVGRPAPEFALAPLDGGAPVTLASLRGRPAVINFWATWCVPCMQEHPTMVEASQRLRDQVQFLGVVFDDQEENVRAFLDENGSPYPSLLDPEGKTAVAYGVAGVPETYFVDPQGVIVSKYVGPLDPRSFERELAKTRGGAQ